MEEKLTGALIGLARATDGNEHLIRTSSTAVIIRSLKALGRGDQAELERLYADVQSEKRKMVPDCFTCAASCGKNNDYVMGRLSSALPEVRELKLRLLDGIRKIADKGSETDFLYQALILIGIEDLGPDDLKPYVEELDEIIKRVR